VAEEFVGAFDTGVIRESDDQRDDMYLSSGDVAGVALAGVQELLKKIDQLERRVAELEAQKK
jgi:polyhydroxyalkanoate synthesis regulator phasin